MSYAYIDYGGTFFRCAFESKIVQEYIKPSRDIHLVSEIKTILDLDPSIRHIAISFAGQVQNNRIESAPNIGIEHLDLNTISCFDGVRFVVENDLKCALLAEADEHNEYDSLAVLYVGTGIGSAYMSHGDIIRGCANTAGEIGHIPYIKRPFSCGCGRNDCLELTASGGGLTKRLEALGIQTHDFDFLRSNPVGAPILEEFEQGVCLAATYIVTLLNPRLLVLGGGVLLAYPYLCETIERFIKAHAMPLSAHTCIVKSSHLINGSLAGARLLAMRMSSVE